MASYPWATPGATMAELARDYSCSEATIWRALAGPPFLRKPGPRRKRRVSAGCPQSASQRTRSERLYLPAVPAPRTAAELRSPSPRHREG